MKNLELSRLAITVPVLKQITYPVSCGYIKLNYLRFFLKNLSPIKQSWRQMQPELVKIATVFAQQNMLPPYVILEVFDALPHRSRLPHSRKIATILQCVASVDRVRNSRIETN